MSPRICKELQIIFMLFMSLIENNTKWLTFFCGIFVNNQLFSILSSLSFLSTILSDLFIVLFMFQQYILSSSTSTIFTIHHLRRLLLLKYKLIKLPRNQSLVHEQHYVFHLFLEQIILTKKTNQSVLISLQYHGSYPNPNPQQIFQDSGSQDLEFADPSPSPSCMQDVLVAAWRYFSPRCFRRCMISLVISWQSMASNRRVP